MSLLEFAGATLPDWGGSSLLRVLPWGPKLTLLSILSSCSLSPWFFSSFVFLLTDVAIIWYSYIHHYGLFPLLVHHWLTICIPQDFSRVIFGDVSHCDLKAIPAFLYTMLGTLLWRCLYALPVSILHTAVMRWIYSGP